MAMSMDMSELTVCVCRRIRSEGTRVVAGSDPSVEVLAGAACELSKGPDSESL